MPIITRLKLIAARHVVNSNFNFAKHTVQGNTKTHESAGKHSTYVGASALGSNTLFLVVSKPVFSNERFVIMTPYKLHPNVLTDESRQLMNRFSVTDKLTGKEFFFDDIEDVDAVVEKLIAKFGNNFEEFFDLLLENGEAVVLNEYLDEILMNLRSNMIVKDMPFAGSAKNIDKSGRSVTELLAQTSRG